MCVRRFKCRLVTAMFCACLSTAAQAGEFVSLNWYTSGRRLVGPNSPNATLSGDGQTAAIPKHNNLEMLYLWTREDGDIDVGRELQLHTGWQLPVIQSMSSNGEYLFVADGTDGPQHCRLRESYLRYSIADGSANEIVIDGRGCVSTNSALAMPSSRDGNVVFAYAGVDGGELPNENAHIEPFRWTEQDGVEFIGVPEGYKHAMPRAASDNGEIMFGHAYNSPGGNVQFRWSVDDGFEIIAGTEGRGDSMRISNDGLRMFGRRLDGDGSVSQYQWSRDEGAIDLEFEGGIAEVSGDGSVLVGSVSCRSRIDCGQSPAIIWTEQSGLLDVGIGRFQAVTVDGTLAGGFSENEDAIIWDEANGVRLLQDVLANETDLGDALAGWTLKSIYEISDDARTFMGFGVNPDGEDRVFIATVDAPIIAGMPGDFERNGVLDISDLDSLHAAATTNSTDEHFDLNGDMIVDSADIHRWVTDLRGSWIGDANLDGEFSTNDFVNVFQAGKYETDQVATWSEGDWNADGRFTTRDFVAAFRDGGYEQGPRPALQPVPEPSSHFLGLIAMLFAFCKIRARSIMSQQSWEA